MRAPAKIAGWGLPALMIAGLSCAPARAQLPPAVTPIVVDTAVPIIINAVKPKPKNVGLGKFEGYVMHANIAQITVRAKGNDMTLETFSLSQQASVKMQTIVDKGGYQYGDKVTVYFDPTTKQAVNFKGKPSKAI
jgi:hypothetical protein